MANRYNPGTRMMAIQSSDAETVTIFGYGVYEGDFPCEYLGGFENPRIKLDDGKFVWGCECWWGPEEDLKKWVGTRTIHTVDIDKIRSMHNG